MSSEVIQVRDVPSEDMEVLRSRAASRNMSLSAYLRELIHEETTRPTMAEVLARVSTRTGVETTTADIRAFIEDDRR